MHVLELIDSKKETWVLFNYSFGGGVRIYIQYTLQSMVSKCLSQCLIAHTKVKSSFCNLL